MLGLTALRNRHYAFAFLFPSARGASPREMTHLPLLKRTSRPLISNLETEIRLKLKVFNYQHILEVNCALCSINLSGGCYIAFSMSHHE